MAIFGSLPMATNMRDEGDELHIIGTWGQHLLADDLLNRPGGGDRLLTQQELKIKKRANSLRKSIIAEILF
jgi:hypothetical protein